MKTKLLTLFVALLMANAMMAQFHIGVKGGANITKVDGKSFKDQFRYGYHLGGFAEIRMGNKFVLQPEVLFNQYATRLDSNYKNVYEDIFGGQSNVKLNYLSIPILLNYKLVGNFIALQVGPQFGVLIDQSKTVLQNGGDAFKKGDFSMLAGLQFRVANLRINGRYAVGLNNISDIKITANGAYLLSGYDS
ncbi:MAG TPA: porin family protein, partial [Chitinophagaceae bacterium]|nr:porin family protein [Chitinophagaceae bacterium]